MQYFLAVMTFLAELQKPVKEVHMQYQKEEQNILKGETDWKQFCQRMQKVFQVFSISLTFSHLTQVLDLYY